MSVIHKEALPKQFQHKFSNRYASVYSNASIKAMICRVDTPYIPIEAFKATFRQCGEIIVEEGLAKFIFDKRNMRAFHQPSMEWYFVHWKQEMFHTNGLRQHRKILPEQPWFTKCVEAGRHEIVKKHPDTIFNQLDIQYTKSLVEAIER